MKVVVIGSGITGLAAARAHIDRGNDVTMVTDQDRPGGVLASTMVNGVPRNHSAQTFALTNALADLFKSWGLTDAVAEAPHSARVRCIVHRGKVHRIASPLHVVTTGLIPMRTILKTLLRLHRPVPAGEPTIADVVRTYADQVVVDRLARPIVTGIYAGDPERLSFKACFPSKRGRRKVVIARQGMSDLVQRMASGIANIRYGWSVQSVDPANDSWLVCGRNDCVHADRVIITVGAHVASELVRPHDELLAGRLRKTTYGGVRLIHCSYNKSQQQVPLQAFGALWADAGPVRGLLNLSVLMNDESDRQYAVVFATPTSTIDEAVDEVRQIFKISGSIDIDLELDWSMAIPQYESGHKTLMQQLEQFETQNPGLHLVGNYRGGVSVGDRIEQGVKTAWIT